MSRANAIRLAMEGEHHRIQGNYTNAIKKFDEALTGPVTDPTKGDDTYAWAYAHRGAAKAAVQDMGSESGMTGFEWDFNRALHFRKLEPPADPNRDYPWVHAQWGEAMRLYARDHLWERPPWRRFKAGDGVDTGLNANIESHLIKAESEFNSAISGTMDNAWTRAHRGALYTFWYYLKHYIKRVPAGDPNLDGRRERDLGDADFTRAVEDTPTTPAMSPTYGWGKAFYAIQLTLRSGLPFSDENPADLRDKARRVLGDALFYDVSDNLLYLQAFALLYNYSGQPARTPADIEFFKKSIITGWQAMKESQDDFLSRYIITSSAVWEMHDKNERVTHPGLLSAIEVARIRLQSIRNLVTALLGGLELLDGWPIAQARTRARDALRDIRKEPDFETYSIINLDRTWDRYDFRSWAGAQGLFQPPSAPGGGGGGGGAGGAGGAGGGEDGGEGGVDQSPP